MGWPYHLVMVMFLIALGYIGPLGVRAQDTSDLAPEQENASMSDEDGGSSVWVTILQYLIILVLVAASGLFSGLTLGLLGLDKIGLEIIGNGDDPRMAGYAKVSRFPDAMSDDIRPNRVHRTTA